MAFIWVEIVAGTNMHTKAHTWARAEAHTGAHSKAHTHPSPLLMKYQPSNLTQETQHAYQPTAMAPV